MSDDNNATESTDADGNDVTDTRAAEMSESPPAGDSDTFTREYVEGLRKENASHRAKAKEVDALARKAHNALVVADGRLIDPDALEYREEHLTDPDALKEAISQLIEAKAWLRAKPVGGDVGQGPRGDAGSGPQSFADLFRN
jgi:hypothetical protein